MSIVLMDELAFICVKFAVLKLVRMKNKGRARPEQSRRFMNSRDASKTGVLQWKNDVLRDLRGSKWAKISGFKHLTMSRGMPRGTSKKVIKSFPHETESTRSRKL